MLCSLLRRSNNYIRYSYLRGSISKFSNSLKTNERVENIITSQKMLAELYNRSCQIPHQDIFFNSNVVKELIQILQDSQSHSQKSVNYAIETLHNLASNSILCHQMVHVGAALPLLKILCSNDSKDTQGLVSLCIYKMHSRFKQKNQSILIDGAYLYSPYQSQENSTEFHSINHFNIADNKRSLLMLC